MHPNCKDCPSDKCIFKGRTVETAISCCQLIPLGSGIRFIDSLTDKEKRTIVLERPLGNEKREFDAEKIARRSLYGKDHDRLNMN